MIYPNPSSTALHTLAEFSSSSAGAQDSSGHTKSWSTYCRMNPAFQRAHFSRLVGVSRRLFSHLRQLGQALVFATTLWVSGLVDAQTVPTSKLGPAPQAPPPAPPVVMRPQVPRPNGSGPRPQG